MHGTYFNDKGFMLDAMHTNGCCVTQYLFELLNNQLETNPRKKIARLTMNNAIDELGMSSIDESCCIAQVADFCKKRKVKFHALGCKHNLFETS